MIFCPPGQQKGKVCIHTTPAFQCYIPGEVELAQARAMWLLHSDPQIPMDAQKIRSFLQALLAWKLSRDFPLPLDLWERRRCSAGSQQAQSMKKLLGCRCGTGTSGSDYLMQTKGSDLGPKAGPDLRGLDEPSPEANAFIPATNLWFATTSATRPENCCSELSFMLGLRFS